MIVALVAGLFCLLGGVFFVLSTSAQTVNAAPANGQAVALAAAADGTDKLLVWAGNGAAPGEHSSAAPGTCRGER